MRNLIPVVVAGCSAAYATASDPYSNTSDIAALRAQGPAMLDALLAQYDRAPTPSLAAEIDAVAGQRYATVSRLYWYTDLDAAQAAARLRHVPILSLRLLGDLREDLSCANSRLFRSTLYANAELSAFLRQHFVLHWSTERPVPRVTIDFGDGQHRLVRTTTGNSAHYVLDEDGNVLDVLPGLYTPDVFRKQLVASLALADAVRNARPGARAAAIVDFQRNRVTASRQAWEQLAGGIVLPKLRRLMRSDEAETALAAAQRAAMSKAVVEVPDLERLGADLKSIADGDVAAWATAGQILYAIGDLPHAWNAYAVQPQKPVRRAALPQIFDARSRGLIERLASVPARPLTRAQLDTMIARLEQSAVADTAQNELRLRPQIAQHIVDTGGRASFTELNAWIYATVFHTPADDAWLGLVTDTDFSGLPGDGVVAM